MSRLEIIDAVWKGGDTLDFYPHSVPCRHRGVKGAAGTRLFYTGRTRFLPTTPYHLVNGGSLGSVCRGGDATPSACSEDGPPRRHTRLGAGINRVGYRARAHGGVARFMFVEHVTTRRHAKTAPKIPRGIRSGPVPVSNPCHGLLYGLTTAARSATRCGGPVSFGEANKPATGVVSSLSLSLSPGRVESLWAC